jgi:threonine dehydratase
MIDFAQIEEAGERLRDRVLLSPCPRFEHLSQLTGADVYIKLENLQITGSFKVRGALNTLLQLGAEQRARGVVAASAGNHAQAVAYGAKLLHIHATIVMPETTPLIKIEGTRAYGANIVLAGQNYDEAFLVAQAIQQDKGLCLIHAFDDERVIAGQATIGLELLQQLPDLDAVIVPVGGGGLIAGIASAIKEGKPDIEVIGIEADRLPAMRDSLAAGNPLLLSAKSTIADGIAVSRVGLLTLPIAQHCIDAMDTVSENEIAHAILYLLEREKTLAEGAAAVGIAALYNQHFPDLRGKKVAVIISGGNIDMTRLSLILERGLEAEHRIVHIIVVMPDTPASVAELADLAREHGAKIINIESNHQFGEVELGEVELAISLETKGLEDVEALLAAIRSRGYVVRDM